MNRRDSKSRVPSWYRGFESPPLRHTVWSILLQLGGSKKSAQGVALFEAKRTGETKCGENSIRFGGILSAQRKVGSLWHLSAIGPAVANPLQTPQPTALGRNQLNQVDVFGNGARQDDAAGVPLP